MHDGKNRTAVYKRINVTPSLWCGAPPPPPAAGRGRARRPASGSRQARRPTQGDTHDTTRLLRVLCTHTALRYRAHIRYLKSWRCRWSRPWSRPQGSGPLRTSTRHTYVEHIDIRTHTHETHASRHTHLSRTNADARTGANLTLFAHRLAVPMAYGLTRVGGPDEGRSYWKPPRGRGARAGGSRQRRAS
jgi:hypothetical protein